MNTPIQYDQKSRLAIEALRNGVPNSVAVQLLGCSQPIAEDRFIQMIEETESRPEQGKGHQGMMVSGGFGEGKSHLLTYLEQIALSRNFVVSRVPISKETPMFDMGKVFISAMENGRLPDRKGRLIEELTLKLNPHIDECDNFYTWAENAAEKELMHPVFPACLRAYIEGGNQELNSEIESFWAGHRLRIGELKKGLKEIGQAANFRFRAPRVSDLPPQHLMFAAELIKFSGYRGWVILLDEIELIGFYSILQRGRSYAELARWMGRMYPMQSLGLIVVGTVTDDFSAKVISPRGDKKDRDTIEPRLLSSARNGGLAPFAKVGMDILEGSAIRLESPDEEHLNKTIAILQKIYQRAYNWQPPPHHPSGPETGLRNRMRYKVRAAINQWDLYRLTDDYQPDIEVIETEDTYETDRMLEEPGAED